MRWLPFASVPNEYYTSLNFSFGLIAILFTNELKEQSALAVALTGLIAAYWVGKVATQIAYYPMYDKVDSKPKVEVETGSIIN